MGPWLGLQAHMQPQSFIFSIRKKIMRLKGLRRLMIFLYLCIAKPAGLLMDYRES